MRGVWYIAARWLLHNRVLGLILAMCLGVAILLPAASGLLADWYATALVARADSTPLIAGAKGNRFDLALASMYWRRSAMPTISMHSYHEIRSDLLADGGTAVPIHVRFTARRIPIVATTPDYFAARNLHAAEGTLPLLIGDVVIGGAAARRMGVGPNDRIYSDQIDTFDISKPPALKMHVAGILARADSPDDDAVFTDIKTAWILEGLAHGHDSATAGVPERLVLERTGKNVSLSEELIEYNEVTPENLASFHLHATDAMLPLTAVLIFPQSARETTLVKSRLNATPDVQAVAAREVIDELLSIVGRLREILRAFFVVLACSTLALTALVGMLSIKVRSRETETLHKIGCSRWFVVRLHAAELALVLLAGVLLAGAGTLLAVSLMPSLVRIFQGDGPAMS